MNQKKDKVKKHPDILKSKRQGYAPRKTTRKGVIDWAHLAKTYKLHAKKIIRHKRDQIYLAALKARLESEE